MKFSKPFEALVTESKHSLFIRARIILTVYYIVAIGLVMAVFSALLYFSLITNLRDTLMDQFPNGSDRHHVYEETTDRFQGTILLGDIVGLLLIGGASYLLAGRTLRPIRQALEDQRRFSSDASHELRTPLAIMQSQSEVALRNAGSTNEELRSVISSGLEESKRMTHLVEDLLAVARSEQGIKKTERVDLEKILLPAIDSIRIRAAEKRIVIDERLEDAAVSADGSAIYRAFLNVLDNAVSYTEPEGSLSVVLTKSSGDAVITVKDTGIGISKADLPNIFKRFYKADVARSYRPGSPGLGLAIVSEIIASHGGTVSVDSKVGSGSEFTISIPLA